jgi:hypothetical protein
MALVLLTSATAFSQNTDAPTLPLHAAWIDKTFAEIWASEDVTSPPLAEDSTFLRRIYLDLLGTIPSVAATRDFLDDKSPNKRQQLVETLLTERRHAENMARVWRRAMVPPGSPNERLGSGIEPWLGDHFSNNVPYDEMVRSLLAVKTGDATALDASALRFYQAAGGSAEGVADAVTRTFLGVRLGCAKCHDHPFADWKQEEFWGVAAFFSGVQGGSVTDVKRTKIRAADTEVVYRARYLWAKSTAQINVNTFPRQAFGDWLTSDSNPNFSATAVNRVWQHLCGHSLAGDVDDLDGSTAEERALVLDKLAKRFSDSKYDVRELIRSICLSHPYQAQHAAIGSDNLAKMRPVKVLTPEQLFDSLEQALMLPVGRADNAARFNGQMQSLVQRMSEAYTGSPSDFSAGIPQALMMMNGTIMSDATSLEESRTLRAVVESPFLDTPSKIETLFLAALTRKPTPSEADTMLQYAESNGTKSAFADIFWSLLNTPEFVLSR